jgi:thymidylate synthase
MKQYLNLLSQILNEGIQQPNRTGIDTLTLPGAMLKFDLRDGFPAVTTKKLAFNQVKGELCGFLEGATSAKRFRELGCTIWDQNANENQTWLSNQSRLCEDDLGKIYGFQWRNFDGCLFDGDLHPQKYGVDQIEKALNTLRNDPESRRNIVSAWNPKQLGEMALPPCHVMFQLLVHPSTNTLHMCMYQRSCDMFLGVPFNIASYALLLSLFSQWSGYTPGTLTMFLADAHIYVNHVAQVHEQLLRDPLPLPRLWLESKAPPEHIQQLPIDVLISSLDPKKIHLLDYQHHPAIRAPMAV